MIIVKDMTLVLPKKEQVKTRVDKMEKRLRSKVGIMSLDAIRTLNVWVATRLVITDLHLIKAGKFRAA